MTTTMTWVALVVLLFAAAPATAAKERARESYIQKLLRVGYEIETNPILKAEWERQMKEDYDMVLPGVEFNCDVVQSTPKPTSVHRLRPSDIDVIGAFGDSITAGNGLGARNAPEVALENRGESFSVGGDESLETVLTLTNVLRKFNKNIKGYSHCPSTRNNERRSWLNVAEPGGTNRDMPEQASFLIERIKNDSRIDILRDWKMLTLFIGGNDLCSSCDDTGRFTPEAYGAKIRETVDILYYELPLVFLNLVPMFDVSPLANYSEGVLCDRLQTRFCDCALNEDTRANLKATQLAYFNELQAIADDPKYTYKEDFAVVLQTHFRDMEPPIDPDTGEYLPGFLGPDCFHPSRLGHQAFAFWLWNTMLTPVGNKPFDSVLNLGPAPNILKCPTTQSPYIFTNTNSR